MAKWQDGSIAVVNGHKTSNGSETAAPKRLQVRWSKCE